MSERLRLVFAGTPEFSVSSLQACIDSSFDVVAVYTQPDRPAGRGRKLAPSPVKQAALDAGIVVEQPESLRKLEARKQLASYRADLMVVVAYGLILSPSVLAMPRLGCWNVHASLLPRWRGAAPIQRAILAGDAETGVGLMQMEAGLDTGPVLLERRTPIASDDTGGSLHDRLAALGADVLSEGLDRLVRGDLPMPVAQPGQGIEYAHKMEKKEAVLDWAQSARALERKVRAFNPWPIAETQLAGERIRVWAATVLDGQVDAAPGSVLAVTAAGIDVATAEGVLRLCEIQRDGGRRMAVRDWLNARPDLERVLRGNHS
jgi:methionyl-tRNA formyltransferase